MNTKGNLWKYLGEFFLEWETLQTKVVKKIKTHILYSIFFPPETRAVYEIMWKNTMVTNRPQITIWRMRFACCIPRATYTHLE